MPNLLTFFAKAPAKQVAKKEGLLTSLFKKKGKGKTVAPATSKAKAPIGAAPKSASASTQTVMATKQSGGFSSEAKRLANTKFARAAGMTAGGAVVIGGSTYALGAMSKKGLSDLGYGVRSLTGNMTDQEVESANIDNAEDRLALLERYTKFLEQHNLSDSPSTREAYDQYIMEGAQPASATEGSSNTGKIITAAAVVGGGFLAYKLLSKKKKGGKK